MLKFFIRLFKAINSNSNPSEIAHGISIALILGFLPKNNLLWYILAIFFIFMRINKGAFAIFTVIFSLITPFLDSLFHKFGIFLLSIPQLQTFYASLLDVPFICFTRFNNTIVAGSLASALILYIPVFIISRIIVSLIRKFIVPLIRKTKISIFIQNLPTIKKIGDITN